MGSPMRQTKRRHPGRSRPQNPPSPPLPPVVRAGRLATWAMVFERPKPQPHSAESYPRVTAISVVVANALPLAGVLHFRWNLLVVLSLYWLETLAIVLTTAFKMQLAHIAQAPGQLARQIDELEYVDAPPRRVVLDESKRFRRDWRVGVFKHNVATGMFMFGHAIFLIALFGGLRDSPFTGSPEVPLDSLTGWWHSRWDLFLGFALFLTSEVIALFRTFLREGQFRTASMDRLAAEPWSRIAGMQVFLIIGSGVGAATGTLRPILSAAAVIKTVFELVALRPRRPASPEVMS